jgi:sphinganine-1-phosphate aldolase
MRVEMPYRGRSWGELREEMLCMRGDDLKWKEGRHGAFVWYANDELEEVVRESYSMFLVENGLGIKVFPSIERMEHESLAIVRSLLHGDEETVSVFTSGGTESIFQAIYAMREWARASCTGLGTPEVVAPQSAHPALNKAAHLLGLRVKRVPVADDYAADVAEIEAAIGPDTVGIYASAPTYSLGIVDPIREIGVVAERQGLWLHVDACVGGVLGNFVRELGYEVPDFDFAVPGVTSISADLHKSGFAAKPASTVTFRTYEHREFARFSFDDWPSGIYSSLTFTGTRPGGAIAAAWAAMQFLGKVGYRQLAADSMAARERIEAGLLGISSLYVHGYPQLYAFGYGSDEVDLHAVAGEMNQSGWYCGTIANPVGIHVMATPVHLPHTQEYVDAIGATVKRVRAQGAAEKARVSYT